MLNVDISLRFPVPGGSGSCTFQLYTKASSTWQPLSPDSCHPRSIHAHWPFAQCTRILSRFSCPVEGNLAVESFKARFFNSFQVRIREPEKKPQISSGPSSWVVLPYNVCFVLGKLSRVVSSLVFPSCFPFCRVRLSWSLGGQHVVHLLRGLGETPDRMHTRGGS